MLRASLKLSILALMVIGGAAGLYFYEKRDTVQVQLDEARRENQQLKEIVTHLQTAERKAEAVVLEQTKDAQGELETTLLFVEYASDGSALPAKRFTIKGNEPRIEAKVINFAGHFVEGRDPLRGKSIGLFERIYGGKQSPQDAHVIDDPGHIPAVYRGADPRVSEFEQELWRDFWRLANDDAYRQQMGVDVAFGSGVYAPFVPGRLYTIRLQHNAGLKVSSEPLKGIYREALSRNTTRSSVR